MSDPKTSIDLGLEILCAKYKGHVFEHREIAAYCGCHHSRIQQIEKSAIRKLRRHEKKLRPLIAEIE